MAIEKTFKVLARIGFSDIVIPLSELEEETNPLVGTQSYFIGYEDEEGRECERDGTYLNQNYKP